MSVVRSLPKMFFRTIANGLEIASEGLTCRTLSGELVAVEDIVRQLHPHVQNLRVITLDEAHWLDKDATELALAA